MGCLAAGVTPVRAPLKVAVVAASLRILGGHSVQAATLLRGWKDDGDVDAWLVPIDPEPPGVLRHARRVKYARTIATELTYLPLLVREIARADVVHVFSASYSSFLLSPLPAIGVAKALGRPVLLNYHSGEAQDHLARSAFARAVLGGVDRIVVPSPYLRDVFTRFSLPATVIPNVVDLDRFCYAERIPLRPRLLSTRNLDHPYNVACTLRAFRLVQDVRPEATLTVVGAGAHDVALRQLAQTLRLANVVFTGRVDPGSIPALYAAHDIYVQTPDIDNMPLSLLEAFASGLPAVSTDAGGVPTILKDGVHGLLAPVGDHAAIAAGVLRLLADPDHAREMARAAHQACGSYSWSAVRGQWLRAYRDALTRPAPGVGSHRTDDAAA
jgi:glycosyltransferase involved in cell wall biosynthesis